MEVDASRQPRVSLRDDLRQRFESRDSGVRGVEGVQDGQHPRGGDKCRHGARFEDGYLEDLEQYALEETAEADLARVAAFDHTMRFAYGVNAIQGNDASPTVQYWRGRDVEVDFVFEVGDTPVPVGLAYHSGERDATLAAVREFKQAYEAPVGLLLAGDTVRAAQPVEELGDGIVQLPYWLYLLLC